MLPCSLAEPLAADALMRCSCKRQVISLADYRGQLYDYLKARMAAIAPNLTTLVGELVGARLIAHAGSLLSLAKHPASTVQILGAEKALFRALKAKHDTPKYGLIYHASLVGQAAPKLKGKVSRVLAAKAALAVRIDALQEDANASAGLLMRDQVRAGPAVGILLACIWSARTHDCCWKQHHASWQSAGGSRAIRWRECKLLSMPSHKGGPDFLSSCLVTQVSTNA